MNNITQEIVEEFKLRIKLDGNEEDANLTRILQASVSDLIMKVGPYTIEENPTFKELVFERSRYVYNDALEYFDTNFVSQLTLLAINNADNGSGGGSTPTNLTREQIVEILGYNPANEAIIIPLDARVTNNTNSINTLNTSVMNNTNSVNQFNVRLNTLNNTLDALTLRVADLENIPQVDLTPVNNRLASLEQFDVSVNQRVTELENNQGSSPGDSYDDTEVRGLISNNTQEISRVNTRVDNTNTTVDGFSSTIGTLDTQVRALDQAVSGHFNNQDIHKTSAVIRSEQNTPFRTEVVSSLPTSNLNIGRIVFDSSDNTFRGYNGGEWL